MSYNDGRRRDRSRSRERDSGAYGGGPPPVPPGAYAGGMRQGAIANLPQLPAFATAGSVSDDMKTKRRSNHPSTRKLVQDDGQ